MLQSYLDNRCYQSANWQHDPVIRGTGGVHPNVKVWYSPNIWTWLTLLGRKGDAPEGGIVIKEQYEDPSDPTKLGEWTVLVRDTKGAWDGWYWADMVPTGSVVSLPPPVPAPGKPNCAPVEYPLSGFGQYCINCHASAASGQNTFATDRFVLGFPPGRLTNFPPEDNIHYRLSHLPRLGATATNDASCLVGESNDHVVASGKAEGGPHTFVTSDQCTGCHNATATLTPARKDLPSMLYYLPSNNAGIADQPLSVNLSPNGEWRFSMMGLAGRDPIFFSQLNSEVTLHGNAQNPQGTGKEFVENLCLHCHGVMGQRQYFADTKKLFTRAQMHDPESPYGALARDGISCTVCHRIAADGLGKPETYTGNFNVGPADHMNGPFSDPLKLPMKNALGMQPQQANQITDSALCGSCHTIVLPVYRANGEPVITNGQPRTFTEQATFFEWQNSVFTDGGSKAESCQQCHMPNTYLRDGVLSKPLAYKIANIEDNTFPAVDHRAPDAKITLERRDDYRRHLLLGINVFALEMFKQFRTELGLYDSDPMLRTSLKTEDGMDTVIDQGTNLIARTRTADVKVISVEKRIGALAVDVQVTNKAGHSFPSGVGFRRAFLNFQVLDGNGDVVWQSGGVAETGTGAAQGLKGVLVDGSGDPLVTETFTQSQQRHQEHYWAKNPIRHQNQVQIYEELVTNPEGYLSTSFVALNEKVKDNRLQPEGWSSTGPQAAETGPVGTCTMVFGKAGQKQVCDPDYENGSGSSVVRYLVPLTRKTLGAVSVKATLYYQTVPPYYQLQRATDAAGVDTSRFLRMVSDLKVTGTPVDKWVLPIGSDEAAVAQ